MATDQDRTDQQDADREDADLDEGDHTQADHHHQPADQTEASSDGEVEKTFDRTVDEGHRRLNRGWSNLLATGLVGGLDVGTGVLAYLLVEQATGSSLLGGVAFSIAFVALALAGSELFTEGFLIPVASVVAGRDSIRSLLRMWVAVLVMNLVGGWVVTWLVIRGYPSLTETALKAGQTYIDYGHGVRALSLAVLAGMTITLMTWMQHATESVPGKLAAAVAFGFLLAGGQLFHSILDSLMVFAALHTGQAPFGYLDWLGMFGTAVLGNLIGGLVLVTLLRLLQVPERLREQRVAAHGGDGSVRR